MSLNNSYQVLFNAVESLDSEQCQKILEHTSSDELLEMDNMLYFICHSHGLGFMNPILRNTIYYKNCINSPNQVLEIVKMLVQKQPKLITDLCYKAARISHNSQILDIMKENEKDSDDESIPSCYICYSAYLQEELFTNVCECKMPIHHRCLVKVLNSSGKKCKTCKKRFQINEFKNRTRYYNDFKQEKFDRRCFSPFDDFYPRVSCGRQYVKVTGVFRVIYAVIYLQIDRLISLVHEMDETIFCNFIKNMNGLVKIKRDHIKLLDLPSDYSRYHNRDEYEIIEDILSSIYKILCSNNSNLSNKIPIS